MSQVVGTLYPSLIPTLSDDATIVEAFQFYHLGLDPVTGSYTANSVEGHLKSVNDRATALETRTTTAETNILNLQTSINVTLPTVYVEQVSSSSTPNVITPQTSSVIPLAIAGVSGQTANLQEWRNSAGTKMSWVDKDGKFWFQGTNGPEQIGEGQIIPILLMGA